jgi:hypothetical protein
VVRVEDRESSGGQTASSPHTLGLYIQACTVLGSGLLRYNTFGAQSTEEELLELYGDELERDEDEKEPLLLNTTRSPRGRNWRNSLRSSSFGV